MSAPTISSRLRGDLTAALKLRTPVTVAALGSSLSALIAPGLRFGSPHHDDGGLGQVAA